MERSAARTTTEQPSSFSKMTQTKTEIASPHAFSAAC
jgi:hypothetical protein